MGSWDCAENYICPKVTKIESIIGHRIVVVKGF